MLLLAWLMRNSSGGSTFAALELGCIHPHAMHDDGQPTRDGNLGAAHADAFGERQPPCLELGCTGIALQDDGCRLEEVRAQQAVAATGDVACHVDVAGLVAPGREAEIRTDRRRMLESCWIVDHGGIGQSDDNADAGHGHQTTRHGIGFGACADLPIEHSDLFTERLPSSEQGFDDRHQRIFAFFRLPNARGEQGAAPAWNDEAEGFHQPANGAGERLALSDQLRARNQEHAQLVSVHAFDGDFTKPAGANDLGQSPSVIGVGFIDLHFERRFGVARIETNDG